MGRHKSRRGGRDDHPRRSGQPESRRPERPPEIFLRQCSWDDAMQRLDQQVRAHRHHGTREVLVVHGRGLGSPGGHGVLGGAVREWCLEHPDLVADWSPAPPFWGGDGAVVLTLKA